MLLVIKRQLMEAGGNGETGSVLATRLHDLDPVRTHELS